MLKAGKEDDEEKGTTRLHNIVVQEVSLVDRAANQRRFLVTKRNEDMKKKLIPDGKGGYIEKADDDEKSDEDKKKEEEEAAKKAKAKGKESDEEKDDDEEEAAKAKGKGKSDEEKDDDEEEAAKAKGKKSGEEDEEKKDEVKKTRVALLVKTAEALAKVAESVNDGADLPDNFVADMTGNLKKIAGDSGASKEVLAGLDDLSKSLAKLKGKAKGDDEEKEDDEEKGEGGKPSKTEKGLTAQVEKLASIVEKQNEEIRKLREEPAGAGNGIVEKGGTAKDDDTAWPMDMAGEDKTSRESAQKRGVSFFD